MMTIVVAIGLLLLLIMLRKSGHSVRHVAVALVSAAALIWAAAFDFVSNKDVVTNSVAYKRFLLLSIVGAAAAFAGLIASIWCSDKPVRIFSRRIGAVALVLCVADVITPY
jgi:hypothetical protein